MRYCALGLAHRFFSYAAFVIRCCDYKCTVDSHKTVVAFNRGPKARVMQKNTLSFLLIATTQPIRLMPAVDQITNRLPSTLSQRRTIDLADDLYLTRTICISIQSQQVTRSLNLSRVSTETQELGLHCLSQTRML